MIEEVTNRHRGFPAQKITCDECAATIDIVCDDGTSPGAVRQKAQRKGWSFTKKKDRCPACETGRRAAKETDVKQEVISAETPPREPTKAQKREIMSLLDEVYDVDAQRYKGADTDVTVAGVLEGVMPGWVAEIREEFFGPAGSQELDLLQEEVAGLRTTLSLAAEECKKKVDEALAQLRALNGSREKLAEMEKRVIKLRDAIGPRAKGI